MFPVQPLDKFDDYSRSMIMYRLCRFVQEHIPEVDDLVLVVYALLMARLASMGTVGEKTDLLHQLQSGSLFSGVSFRDRSHTQRLSDLSFEVSSMAIQDPPGSNMHINGDFMAQDARFVQSCFFPLELGTVQRRYPIPEQLTLLWSDALAMIKCRFPALEEHVRSSLLVRSRYQGYPAAIIALSS